MMAKKFMYVCIGIMALAVTFHVGAQYGSAESVVDHTMTGIVAYEERGGEHWVLLDNGEVWKCDAGGVWSHTGDSDVPIPVSEIKFWGEESFVTYSDELWDHTFSSVWVNFGTPPGGPTPTQPSTWGKIKAEWGE